ncbi:MAG: nucleoside hydrolase [Candidatus Solibacter usitatus]|nr:nucleoside hydrolase [Candidatus Solibacter usitatus]
MKTSILIVLFSMLAMAGPPVPVIFDTDMGNDIDDALALAMLHGLQGRGEIRLAAVTVTKDNPWAARYVSAVNTFYGRGGIPIGVVRNGVTKDEGGYSRKAIDNGRHVWSEKTEDAVGLLRRVLEGEADGSVVVIQVGFSTNLAGLLDSPGGRELVARKVMFLSLMAGDFAGRGPEYNVKQDVKSCKKVAQTWPTARIWSGFEVGRTIKYPAASIERDFGWAPKHPVVDGYKAYMKFPYDRETWDLTAVLYALRPGAGYFDVSAAGTVVVDDKGFTKFTETSGGLDRYLKVNDVERARALEAMIWLASEPAR